MFRIFMFFWRLLCVLLLVDGVLQLMGFFLPYGLTVNTVTHTTVEADSYSSPLVQIASGNINSLFPAFFSLFALATILTPMSFACANLIVKLPRSFLVGGGLSAFILAVLGLLECLFFSFGNSIQGVLCREDVCPLSGESGVGFWFLLYGSLISAVCLLLLIILGAVGTAFRAVRYSKPRFEGEYSIARNIKYSVQSQKRS